MTKGKLILATCQHPVGGNITSNLGAIVKLARVAKSKKAGRKPENLAHHWRPPFL